MNTVIESYNYIIKDRIKTIEILNSEKELQRVIFPAPKECKYLDSKAKDEFLQEVNRYYICTFMQILIFFFSSSPTDKVNDFLFKRPVLSRYTKHKYNVQTSFWAWVTHDRPWKWSNLLLILTITMNCLFLAYYKGDQK